MLRDPDRHVMEKAYARWAPIYDVLCGPVFVNGRRAAARAARDVGGRILEIGVGTGLSFDDYDATTEITGIDISEPMIARARERLKSGRYPFVKELRGDGCACAGLCRRLVRLRRRPIRHHAGGKSGARAVGMRTRACGRAVRSSWSIISTRSAALLQRSSVCWRRRRATLGLRPEFPFQRLADWAQSARWCRADRAAQGQAVRRLHAGAVSARRGAMRGSLKVSDMVNDAVTKLKRATGTCRA